MVPAEASAPRMKETGPAAVRPEDRGAWLDRMRDRLPSAPEPPLKMVPSALYQARIDSMVSSTDRMKQALTCAAESGPTLNQTGELKLNIWCARAYFSSWSK